MCQPFYLTPKNKILTTLQQLQKRLQKQIFVLDGNDGKNRFYFYRSLLEML